MQLVDAEIVGHEAFQGEYRRIAFSAPAIAAGARPGQFVHLKVPHMNESVLRRPFSIFRTDGDTLSLLYKAVGRGTQTMRNLQPGERVSLIGPLGRGFPPSSPGTRPVLVAGGYGMAALYLLARGAEETGEAFFGGARDEDILCVQDFEELGWPVQVATEDGSLGVKGLVTRALDRWLEDQPDPSALTFYACGPNAMLRAVSERALKLGSTAWVSVDRNMGCGVGACLTCVVKVKKDDGDWTWARSCKEGPVFECRDLIWEED